MTDSTIKSLNNGKSPGPDGLGSEIYKKFGVLLVPYLYRLYTCSHDDGTLPQALNEATITLLLKKREGP